MAKQAKRTKKFVKNRLDHSIKERKERQRKSAQVQRRKGKRTGPTGARLNGRTDQQKGEPDASDAELDDEEPEQESDGEKIRSTRKPGSRMTVDEFMGGGFQGGSEADDDDEDDDEDDLDSDEDDLEDVDALSDGEDDDEGRDHAQDLAKLAELDPEFYKYLQENDKELLEFGAEQDNDSDEAQSEDEDAASSSRLTAKGKKDAKSSAQVVTASLLRQWQRSILTSHSLRALRKLLMAFRAAAHMGAEDTEGLAYVVNSAAVFNKLIMTALKYVPVVLHHHIGYKQLPSGKYRLPTNNRKFSALQRSVQSYFLSLHRLLRTLPEPKLLYICVDESAKMIPYILQNRRLARAHAKILLELWSTAEENVRIASFLGLRKLAAAGDAALLELCLHGAYRGLVRGSKAMSLHSMANINLMKNSASELYLIDLNVGYQQAFGFIRQLAIHLRACLKDKTAEAYQAVYNWQYLHCLDFWTIVLSASCDRERVAEQGQASIMQPFIYPLVQAATGAVRLIPTSRYFPLRLHVVQSLLRLMQRTGTYVPLAPLLLEMLEAPEFAPNKAKASTLTPLHLDLLLRAPKSHLRTKVYADQLADEVSYHLLEFLAIHARSIALPELVIPIVASLKRSIKLARSRGNQSARDLGRVIATWKALLDKIERHVDLVRAQRNGVDFAPRDQGQVQAFMSQVKQDLPLETAVKQARKAREEKRALLQRDDAERDEEEDDEEDDEDEEMDLDDEDLEDE